MEDVDRILKVSLKRIGYDFPDDGLAGLTSTKLVEVIAYCLKFLDNSLDIPSTLPADAAPSAKFRVGSQLAQALQDAGYKGEIGYHQLLYPNARSSRQILLWLMEALPRVEMEAETISSDKDAFRFAVRSTVAKFVSEGWVPPFLRFDFKRMQHFSSTVLDYPTAENASATPLRRQVDSPMTLATSLLNHYDSALAGSGKNQASSKYRREAVDAFSQAFASLRASKSDTAPASLEELLEGIGLGAGQESRFATKTIFEQDKKLEEVAVTKDQPMDREQQVNELSERMEELKSLTMDMEYTISQQLAAEGDRQKSIKETAEAKERLMAEHDELAELVALLPDYDKNKASLESNLAAAKTKFESFDKSWQSKKLALDSELEELSKKFADTASTAADLEAKMTRLRVDQRRYQSDLKAKELQVMQMKEEVRKLPDDVNRQTYVDRIAEINKSVKKQKLEIERSLIDVRKVQKQINVVTETLNRTFGETEDMIYTAAKDPKKAPACKEAYRLVVKLHTDFSRMVNILEDTAKASNMASELRQKLDSEKAKASQLADDNVAVDLKAIKEENKALAAKLAKLKGRK